MKYPPCPWMWIDPLMIIITLHLWDITREYSAYILYNTVHYWTKGYWPHVQMMNPHHDTNKKGHHPHPKPVTSFTSSSCTSCLWVHRACASLGCLASRYPVPWPEMSSEVSSENCFKNSGSYGDKTHKHYIMNAKIDRIYECSSH